MKSTNDWLNNDAAKNKSYYAKRSGSPLEDDVVKALKVNAAGTAFENRIQKISGQRFPDIIAARYYGIEVKSTKEDKWTSTGSSILESTRIQDVERIYMTFGKLGGKNVEFISRPYEECLCDIAVTHMPRYRINMKLVPGETIFDKMGISYDDLRSKKNPIKPVADYYKSRLAPGERLWWADSEEDSTTGAVIKLFKNLSKLDKAVYIAYGCVNFPQVFRGDYDAYVAWMASRSVVHASVRDEFSAGGRIKMKLCNENEVSFPAIFRRVIDYQDIICCLLGKKDSTNIHCTEYEEKKEWKKKISSWGREVAKNTAMARRTQKTNPMSEAITIDALETLFGFEF